MHCLRIGPVTYTVDEFDWPPEKDQSQAMGRHHPAQSKIMINSGMTDDAKRVVLWHELLHAILFQAGHEHDEGAIDALSNGIVQVLQDNPWLRGEP